VECIEGGMKFHLGTLSLQRYSSEGQWRAQKIWGGFIQWHMEVICIWYALFVTSQIYVIFMFQNQCFGEVS